MTRLKEVRHRFVENVPEKLEPGVIYVSIGFSTAIHACACGCGSEVVTPIRPNKWTLSFDGESVSLSPSIGSWSLECQSHYFIRRNRIRWVPRWQPKESQ